MSYRAKREYLDTIRARYRNASRNEKKWILDEFCLVCGYARKHAIRLLSAAALPVPQRPGRKPIYGPEVIGHVQMLWIRMGEICSKKMVVALPYWLEHYRPERFPEDLKKQILGVSASTIDRMLQSIRKNQKGLSSTKSSVRFKNLVPIHNRDHKVTKPGYMQGDSVAHCGDTLAGAFAYSLTLTDIHSTWTENRAAWTKEAAKIVEQIADIEKRLPFELLGMNTDSGSEFINYQFAKYMREDRIQAVDFTRSRPYKKNDQAYVEQKNFTHVRQLFGYERIETQELVLLMNEIYMNYWNPLQNFFIPSTKLLTKVRVGSKIKKTFEIFKTPYQRLLDSADISEERKAILRELYKSLNPFELKDGLEKKLKEFSERIKFSRSIKVA